MHSVWKQGENFSHQLTISCSLPVAHSIDQPTHKDPHPRKKFHARRLCRSTRRFLGCLFVGSQYAYKHIPYSIRLLQPSSLEMTTFQFMAYNTYGWRGKSSLATATMQARMVPTNSMHVGCTKSVSKCILPDIRQEQSIIYDASFGRSSRVVSSFFPFVLGTFVQGHIFVAYYRTYVRT